MTEQAIQNRSANLDEIVMAYGIEGDPYSVNVEPDGNFRVETRMLPRKLLMQLVAYCDNNKMTCYIMEANKGHVMFRGHKSILTP